MIANSMLHYTGRETATFFVWVPETEGCLKMEPTSATPVTQTVRKPNGEEVDAQWGEMLSLDTPGIWEVTLSVPDDSADAVTFNVHTEGDVYPFVVPGPGITPSHFPTPEPTLLFAAEGEASVWLDVPEDLPLLTVAGWIPAGSKSSAQLPDGTLSELSWKPDQGCFYRVAEMKVQGHSGWWQLRMSAPNYPFRWTVWEGLPMFLRRPPGRFPYARILCTATDEEGKPLDARFRLFREGKLIGFRDKLSDTRCILYALPGTAVVQASHGLEFERSSEIVSLAQGETKAMDISLRRLINPRPGWICGDHHTHSYYEDGGQSPDKIARAARAAGLNYVFLTDEPEPLLDYGLDRWNEEGRFLALPGQEIATEAVHMNALNTRRSVGKTSSEIADWLRDVEAQSTPKNPMTVMLNHPSHMTGAEERHAYFRSWWVADKYDQVLLVENFDFPSWFERLNRGRKLTGLWTTDGHDVTFLPPGKKRTYVFVGEEFSEKTLMEALKQGRCFSTRYPGAWLTLTVNGAMMGETAEPNDEGVLDVAVCCEATRPIEYVELIADGGVTHVWHGDGSMQLAAKIRLQAGMRWLSARAFLYDEKWKADGHSMEPLMASGCAAFTNPVWVEMDVKSR
ncbi:CehA/McbA family metallohydrolase [Candidatus Poribacteria bacterium]